MGFRRLGFLAAGVTSIVALSGTPAFAQDCFLTHASPNSHGGNSSRWFAMPLAGLLAAPPPDGFSMCQAQIDATLTQAKAAGLPTVFFVRTDKVLPDAGGPGKGGIDHFDDSPLIGQLMGIAESVLGSVSCP